MAILRTAPLDAGEKEIAAFLSHLAIEGQVAASTQNQALVLAQFDFVFRK
jgi:hypothetical protein